jgi:hypothetical protein
MSEMRLFKNRKATTTCNIILRSCNRNYDSYGWFLFPNFILDKIMWNFLCGLSVEIVLDVYWMLLKNIDWESILLLSDSQSVVILLPRKHFNCYNWMRRCYWHLVGRCQGWCQTAGNSQNNRIVWLPTVNSARNKHLKERTVRLIYTLV